MKKVPGIVGRERVRGWLDQKRNYLAHVGGKLIGSTLLGRAMLTTSLPLPLPLPLSSRVALVSFSYPERILLHVKA